MLAPGVGIIIGIGGIAGKCVSGSARANELGPIHACLTVTLVCKAPVPPAGTVFWVIRAISRWNDLLSLEEGAADLQGRVVWRSG
jgi:hypothetical protein